MISCAFNSCTPNYPPYTYVNMRLEGRCTAATRRCVIHMLRLFMRGDVDMCECTVNGAVCGLDSVLFNSWAWLNSCGKLCNQSGVVRPWLVSAGADQSLLAQLACGALSCVKGEVRG